MKKTSALALLTIVTLTLQAQNISYPIENLAGVGNQFHIEKITYEAANMPLLNEIDAEGWDFSSIDNLEQSITRVQSKNDFPELAELPEATLVMERDANKICLLPENNYLKMLGILANVEGTNIPMLFPEPQDMLHFPLAVGEGGADVFSFPIAGKPSDFGLSIPLADSVKFVVDIISTTDVAAIGSLSTYQYTHDAFKVLITSILSVDVWAKTSFTGWFLYEEDAVTDSVKMLQYYTPQYGIPVCEITMNWNNEIKSFQMIDKNPENIYSFQDQMQLYPNPAKSGTTIKLSQQATDVRIFDAIGKLLRHYPKTKTIDTQGLRPGIYIISQETIPQNQKLIIQ